MKKLVLILVLGLMVFVIDAKIANAAQGMSDTGVPDPEVADKVADKVVALPNGEKVENLGLDCPPQEQAKNDESKRIAEAAAAEALDGKVPTSAVKGKK